MTAKEQFCQEMEQLFDNGLIHGEIDYIPQNLYVNDSLDKIFLPTWWLLRNTDDNDEKETFLKGLKDNLKI